MPESTGSNGMTLQDYLKIFRHRWLVIAACTLAAAAVMWAVTPASTDTTLKVGSYTATATLLVGSSDANETSVSMARIPLYLTTGEVPKRAARRSATTATRPCSPRASP